MNTRQIVLRLPSILPNEPSRIFSYLDRDDRSYAISSLSTSCVTLYAQTSKVRQKRILEKLLQAVIDHNPLKVSNILNAYPGFLLAKSEDYFIEEIESQFTWRRYLVTGESAFSIAQKLQLVDVINIMLPYFFRKLDDAQYAPYAEHQISELKKQWILPAISGGAGYIDRQGALREHYIRTYLAAPINASLSDTAIDNLRTELFKPRTIQECIDADQLFAAACRAYDPYQHDERVYGISLIGLIQSLGNSSCGQRFCAGLPGSFSEKKQISELALSLRLRSGQPFYRTNRDSHSGLGFDFFCGVDGAAADCDLQSLVSQASMLEVLCVRNADECNFLARRIYDRIKSVTAQLTPHVISNGI